MSWQIPEYSIPVGKGPGWTGFAWANPGAAGGALVSNGAAAAPSFTTAPTWTGRHTWSLTPTYDLASGVLGVGIFMPLSDSSIPAHSQWNYIRLSKTYGDNPVFTVGDGGIATGLFSSLTSGASSNVNSNVYGSIFHATNSGPGNVRGVHLGGYALAGSTGFISAAGLEIQPVSTTAGAWGTFANLASGAADDIAIAHGIESGGARYSVAVGSSIAAVPINLAFFRAWIHQTASAANARAFHVLNTAGNELAYIHKDGSINAPSLTLSVNPLAATSGGTGLSAYTLGDMIYSGAANALTRLAGNASTTKKILSQTGDGSNSAAPVWETTTGTGSVVLATSPTLVTPALGVPSSGTLINCTGLPISGVSGLGTGVAAFLAAPSSANLAAAITGKTGTGALVFGTAPTFTTSATTPAVYGGTAAASFLDLRGTSHGTPSGDYVTISAGGSVVFQATANVISLFGASFGLAEKLAVPGFIAVGTPSTGPAFLLGDTGIGTAVVGGMGPVDVEFRANNTEVIRLMNATSRVKFSHPGNWTPAGTVATTMTSRGPTGASTTVQERLTVVNSSGTVRYIPCY